MKYILQATLLFFLVIAASGISSAGSGDDITVTVRATRGSVPAEFRAETVVKSTLSGVVALFEDLNSMPSWVYRMKEATALKRISRTEVIARTVTALPPPLQDRDAVLYTTLTQDKSGVIRITGKDMTSFYPPCKGIVRMERIWSYWEFIPLKGGNLKVIFAGSGNPGGIIPIWVYNRLLGEAPYNTMKNFKKMISRERYQRSSFNFIKEWPDGIRAISN